MTPCTKAWVFTGANPVWFIAKSVLKVNLHLNAEHITAHTCLCLLWYSQCGSLIKHSCANPQLWGWTSWHAVDTDTKTDSYADHWVVYLHIYTMCCCFLQISNEIIRLCCREISLDRIFQGYVISSKQILNDCIQCCLAWKELYLHTSQLQHKYCVLQS